MRSGPAPESSAAAPAAPAPVARAGRWVGLALAGGGLLLLGHFGIQMRALTANLLSGRPLDTPVHAPVGSILAPSVPAGLLYIGLYLGLSILVLHLALADRRRSRLVLLLYGGALALVAVLLAGSRLPGIGPTSKMLAYELMGGGPVDNGGLLSPLPVLLLLAVFRLAPVGAPPPEQSL